MAQYLHATPEAIDQMKAELAEIGGEGLVAFLEMQSGSIEAPDVTPDFPEEDRGSVQKIRAGSIRAGP